MGARKCVYLKEGEEEQFEKIKKQYGLKSDSAVISFLLQSGTLTENLAKAVIREMEENYMKSERLKWGVKTAEQNSVVLLDAINTILHALKLEELISVDLYENPVIKESRKKLDEKIENRKQRKKRY